MIDKDDSAQILRIAGIGLSITSAVVMFIRPLDPIVNTLLVYFLLIAAAMLVMIGQFVTIRMNLPGDFKSTVRRNDAVYDVITIGVVMVLFVLFYVMPYVNMLTN